MTTDPRCKFVCYGIRDGERPMKIDWMAWLICIFNLSLYALSSEPFSDVNLFFGSALFGILAKETAAQYRKSKET